MDVVPKPPSMKGPAEWFTGDVWIDPIARGEPPARINVSAVRFNPGARTAWRSHGALSAVCLGLGRAAGAAGRGARRPAGAG
jgi:quercetin dioxygenase-like cupin family protein